MFYLYCTRACLCRSLLLLVFNCLPQTFCPLIDGKMRLSVHLLMERRDLLSTYWWKDETFCPLIGGKMRPFVHLLMER